MHSASTSASVRARILRAEYEAAQKLAAIEASIIQKKLNAEIAEIEEEAFEENRARTGADLARVMDWVINAN